MEIPLLNAQEIQTLATYFDISIDEILKGKRNKTFFSYNIYERSINNFLEYIQQINWQISEFYRRPEFRVHYASREIPIFIYMMFPRLLTFKLYVYGLTVWRFEYLQNKRFTFDLVNATELSLAEDTSRLYCSIDSTDYWTLSILEQTLNQIEYVALEGRFENNDDALTICHEIQALVEHCRSMAESGKEIYARTYSSVRKWEV